MFKARIWRGLCLKLTIEIAGRRQCPCIAILTVTFNCYCLLVVIFPLNNAQIIEICQIFSSFVFFEIVEAGDKTANQKNLVRQTKNARVDSGVDELCFIICILAWSNSSKLISVYSINFSFSSLVFLGGAHSGIE